MLSTKRCPHTGIVNYFDTVDPHFSVGSIARATGQKHFLWRCYSAGTDQAGRTKDLKTAEHDLMECYGVGAAMAQRRSHAA